jgi:mono/diheme cytochrome c family protein
MNTMRISQCKAMIAFLMLPVLFISCNQKQSSNDKAEAKTLTASNVMYGGFKSEVLWGKHLVTIGGCGHCHTPKKMTAMGPVPDMAIQLSGHPVNAPVPDINRKEMEGKGLIVTNDLTVWIGPWGVSYAANLTPDESGIGNWTSAQFIKAIREQKFQGLDGTRPLLPPMSFVAEDMNSVMSDAELEAVFAYLKSIKPIHNLVPQPQPPTLAARK